MHRHNILRLCSFLILLSLTIARCNVKKEPQLSQLSLQGTWELISDSKIENGDTTYTPARKNVRMIKIINQTHFAFLRHDLIHGKDSSTAEFVAGGGPYTLNGTDYTENLEYCNSRDWESNVFHFTVGIQGDTLTQQGREKVEKSNVDRIIIEKYVRVLK